MNLIPQSLNVALGKALVAVRATEKEPATDGNPAAITKLGVRTLKVSPPVVGAAGQATRIFGSYTRLPVITTDSSPVGTGFPTTALVENALPNLDL